MLKMPAVLVDYKMAIQVTIRYDDERINMRQGPTPIDVPECPIDPLVTMQTISDSGTHVGPIYVWDYEREDWYIYDEDRYPIPQSKSNPVEVGTSDSEPSQDSADDTPASDAPDMLEAAKEWTPYEPDESDDDSEDDEKESTKD